MRVIKPSYKILTDISDGVLEHIEKAIRVCYKSEDKIKEGSAEKIVKGILDKKHMSTIEHYSFTVQFVCNRGFTHEMVRHRLASYSQESTRFCSYAKNKFGNEITVIQPTNFNDWSEEARDNWTLAMSQCEEQYFKLIKAGLKAEDARGVLPIDLKTEIVITANLREWRHIFQMRTSKYAHPSMRELMIPLLKEIQGKIPVIFDIEE
jgi:thymidylate synthase (FAD)